MSSLPDDGHLDGLHAAWAEDPLNLRRRDQLVIAAQPLVQSEARRVHSRSPQGVEVAEMVANGQLGLLSAVASYDSAFGTSFAYYARRRIRGAIIDGLPSWAPKRVRAAVRAMDAAQEELVHRLGRVPTDHELAGRLRWSVERLETARRQAAQMYVVPMAEHDDDDHDPAQPEGSDEGLSIVDVREAMATAIRAIDDLELRQVLYLYYVQKLPMTEVAKTMGISLGKVSKLRDRAVRRIRDNLAPTFFAGLVD